jgi:hypothetical protein
VTDRDGDRVTLIVQPSAAHPNVLSVQDAMKQVLDFFDLLTPEGDGASGLVWNLELASTNSPLRVVGEAVSLDPAVDVSVIARAQRQLVSDQLRSLSAGRRPVRAISRKRRETYKRFFRRNVDGIGKTEATLFAGHAAISITPAVAVEGINAIVREEKEFDALVLVDREREEIGSIEGQLLEVSTEYNQPAILVRERKSGREIWCRVDADLKHSVSDEARFEDVWDRKRVIVRGRLAFNSDGELTRVRATSVMPLAVRQMTLNDIKDQSFTSEYSSQVYIEKLREGELG